jgi:hypothetical protein
MTNEILAAIHQPSFFPWLGFFDKIKRSGIFIILDNVQFPKTGGYWANRVMIMIDGSRQWLTIPIVRNYSGTRLINEMEINNLTRWREKMIKTININYRKAPFYSEVFPLISKLLSPEIVNLAKHNIRIIERLCDILEINIGKMLKASEIPSEGAATDLLISLVKQVGGNAYMCGGGAANYQEDEKFGLAGIKLVYQNFKHPEYSQFNSKTFVPGLSIIDALMNVGIEGVKVLMGSKQDSK